MGDRLFRKGLAVGIIFLFIGMSVTSTYSLNIANNEINMKNNNLYKDYFMQESFFNLYLNIIKNRILNSNNIYKNAVAVQQTRDNGYIVTGFEEESEPNDPYHYLNRTTLLIKFDANGKNEWRKNFKVIKSCEGISIQQTEDNGYIIGGSAYSIYNWYAMLIKTDEQGNEEWIKTYSGLGTALGTSVHQTVDKGYIITGSSLLSSINNSSFFQLLLLKTDEKGNEEWYKTYNFWNESLGFSIQQTEDKGYIITGLTRYNNSSDPWESKIILIKTDEFGNEIWRKTYSFLYINQGLSVKKTKDKSYIIAGFTGSIDNIAIYAILIKVDEEGNILWYKTFNYGIGAIGLNAEQTYDDGYMIAGYATNLYKYFALLIKTDEQGNQEWIKTYSGLGCAVVFSAQQTIDKGYILSGTTFKILQKNEQQIFLIKTNENGNLMWTNNLKRNSVEYKKIQTNALIQSLIENNTKLFLIL